MKFYYSYQVILAQVVQRFVGGCGFKYPHRSK